MKTKTAVDIKKDLDEKGSRWRCYKQMGKESHTLHPKLLTSMIESNWSRKRGVDGTFSLFVSFTTVLELKYHPTFVIFGIQN